MGLIANKPRCHQCNTCRTDWVPESHEILKFISERMPDDTVMALSYILLKNKARTNSIVQDNDRNNEYNQALGTSQHCLASFGDKCQNIVRLMHLTVNPT